MISDSMFKHTESVEGGDVFYRQTKTCQQIADILDALHVELRAYHVVIFCVGTNDCANLDPAEQARSLERFCRFLKPLVNHPSLLLILNTGIGVNGWPGTSEYAQWFTTTINDRFSDSTNIHFCDWSGPGVGNPFMNAGRKADSYYMDPDELHPSQHGLRRMLKRWISIYPALASSEHRVSIWVGALPCRDNAGSSIRRRFCLFV